MIADLILLGPLSLVASLSAGLIAMMARRTVHNAREVELREAIELLRIHVDSLDRLDDDATPETLLVFALKLSSLLHDPGELPSTLRVLRRGTTLNDSPTTEVADDGSVMRGDYDRLVATRPDLATAFIQSIVAGIMSFEKRWPDCAGVLSTHLSRVVAAPMEEAQRIVRAASGSTHAWTAGPVDAVAA